MNNGNTPAIPIFNSEGFVHTDENGHTAGLTKREYFAGLIIQGMNANHKHQHTHFKAMAELAVKQADALLKELEEAK